MTRLFKNQQPGLSSLVQALATRLSKAGYKVTQPRLAVLTAAAAMPGSFTAIELDRWLDAQEQHHGEASIFRTLKLFTELGIMQRVHGRDECHRYALSEGHRHYLVCSSCGDTVAFDGCALDTLSQQLQQSTGYRIEAHLLEFFGHCPRCMTNASA